MSMDADDAGERGPARRSRRDSLFLLTVLSCPDGKNVGNARVRNLSETGLMADCERPFSPDDRISMKLRGVGEVQGQIAWVKGDRIGVTFDSPIDPKLARKPVAEPTSDALPGYLRPHIITPRVRR